MDIVFSESEKQKGLAYMSHIASAGHKGSLQFLAPIRIVVSF